MGSANTASLVTFEADLDKFSALIDVEFEAVVRRIVLELYDKITRRTPVDTGRARASWMIATGAPGEGVPDLRNFTQANQTQRGKVAEMVKKRAIMWIYNNQPYIKRLEQGSSQQAPQGMVARSVAEVEAMVDAMIAEVESGKTGPGETA